MGFAKAYVRGLYLHLILSVAVPIAIIATAGGRWTPAGKAMAALYLLVLALVQGTGWIAFIRAAAAYRRDDTAALLGMWKVVKLHAVPFYVLNFIYSVFAWFAIVAASRGIFIVLLPLPVAVTFLLFLPGACTGLLAVRQIQEHLPQEERPSAAHCVYQFIFLLDIFSTFSLLRRWGSSAQRR